MEEKNPIKYTQNLYNLQFPGLSTKDFQGAYSKLSDEEINIVYHLHNKLYPSLIAVRAVTELNPHYQIIKQTEDAQEVFELLKKIPKSIRSITTYEHELGSIGCYEPVGNALYMSLENEDLEYTKTAMRIQSLYEELDMPEVDYILFMNTAEKALHIVFHHIYMPLVTYWTCTTFKLFLQELVAIENIIIPEVYAKGFKTEIQHNKQRYQTIFSGIDKCIKQSNATAEDPYAKAMTNLLDRFYEQ